MKFSDRELSSPPASRGVSADLGRSVRANHPPHTPALDSPPPLQPAATHSPAPPRTARPRARRSRRCRSGGAEEAEEADSARREARGDQAAAAASLSSGDGKQRLELWPEHCARRGPALSAQPTTPAQPAGSGPAPAQGQGLRKRAPGSYGTAGR